MIGISFGSYHYWKVGPINFENITSLYETSLKTKEINENNPVKQIRKLVESDRVREAVKALGKLEKNTREIDRVKHLTEYNSYLEGIKESKKSMNKLLSSPALSRIILVLSNKVSNFEAYVVQNNWRTLTRMAKRIKAKIVPTRVHSPGFFNYSKMKKLSRTISSDMGIMINVTESSILTQQNKIIILAKIRAMQTELNMFNRYLKNLKSFSTSYGKFSSSYNNWFSKILPEITLQRINLEENSKYILYSLFGVIAFILAALFAGWMVYSRSVVSSQNSVEKVILQAVKDGIVPTEGKFSHNFSQNFNLEFNKFHSYIHKRMSFGAVFQDAVPFSAFLLDANLNLSWGNKLFYQTWGITDLMGDEHVSWDFLQQSTNLGENDPIFLAIQENLAGIYQIQLRTKGDEEGLPYEMYVAPVEYADQKRVMVFLYPLRSIEESLSNQMKSVVGPVTRTLEAMTNNGFTGEFREKIYKDFEIAGITDVVDKFQKYSDFVSQQKLGLLGEIEKLENELFDQFKLADDLRGILVENQEVNTKIVDEFYQAKDSIISSVEFRNEVEQLYQNTVVTAKSLFKDESELLTKSEACIDIIGENTKAFNMVSKVRTDFKDLRKEVETFKSRIVQTLDQALIFQRRDENSSKVEDAFSRIKMEVRGFDKTLGAFSQSVQNLDIGLSKVELLMEQNNPPELTNLRERFSDAQENIESDMFHINRLERTGQGMDASLISSLKSLYEGFQSNRIQLQDMSLLLGERNESEALGTKDDLMLDQVLRQDDGQTV